MNNAKLNVYKKVLQEVCKKFDCAKEFIRDKIEDIGKWKITYGGGNLFVYKQLRQLLRLRLVVFVKTQASFTSILQASFWVYRYYLVL